MFLNFQIVWPKFFSILLVVGFFFSCLGLLFVGLTTEGSWVPSIRTEQDAQGVLKREQMHAWVGYNILITTSRCISESVQSSS